MYTRREPSEAVGKSIRPARPAQASAGAGQAEWWLVAGYAYAQLGQYQRAADGFQQAVRLAPDEIDSWNLLGQAYRSLGQPERAIRTLDNALRVSQDSPMTW